MSSTPPKDDGDRAPAANNTSSQPSIMNIKTQPTNTLMRVDSDILEPLTFSQTECVFELAPKGFLHPGSAISIFLDYQSNIGRAFPYVNSGIHSLIRRAVLRTTAGRTINDTEDLNVLNGLRATFVNGASNKEREQYLSGRMMDYEINYDDETDFTSTTGYVLSNGMEQNLATGNQQGYSMQPTQLNVRRPEYQIKIHDLFNYCKEGNQLPLFLLPNERIQIVLYFAETADNSSRLAVAAQDDANVAEAITISRNDCKFIADYVFYDGEIMDKFAAEYTQGLTFAYTDYRLSKQSITAANALNNVRNIGGNGSIVNKVLMAQTTETYPVAGGAANGTYLMGKYNSQTPSALGGVGNNEINLLTGNLFVNSQFLYPQFISNPARQFHNLKEAEGLVPYLPRQVYSGQGDGGLASSATTQFEGRAQDAQLGGLSFYQGYRLEGLNARVSNTGIDIHYNAVEQPGAHDNATGTKVHRAWLELKRYLVISDGHLESYFV